MVLTSPPRGGQARLCPPAGVPKGKREALDREARGGLNWKRPRD